jgi:RHS repeat-associated protein
LGNIPSKTDSTFFFQWKIKSIDTFYSSEITLFLIMLYKKLLLLLLLTFASVYSRGGKACWSAVKSELGGVQKSCSEYDALGRRTAKVFKDKITRFVWDGNVLLHEWDYNIADRPKQVADDLGQILLDREEPVENLITWIYEEGSFVPSGKIINHEKFSIISDYLGRPVQAFAEGGQKVWEADYGIYGQTRNQRGPKCFVPFRQLGQYEDEEIPNQYYNRFRYYSAETGTYLSQDPIGLAGGNNLYGYVHNPNAWADVFGLNPGLVRVPIAGATPEAGSRGTAINRAWGQERDMINRTGGGTRAWNQAELDIILDPDNTTADITSQMSRNGYTGHHINNVHDFPAWQGDGRNIIFLPNAHHPTLSNEHLYGADGHGGAYHNRTTGDLIDRPNCK